jgi:hypothetical protein
MKRKQTEPSPPGAKKPKLISEGLSVHEPDSSASHEHANASATSSKVDAPNEWTKVEKRKAKKSKKTETKLDVCVRFLITSVAHLAEVWVLA